jgi:hypothetical protein
MQRPQSLVLCAQGPGNIAVRAKSQTETEMTGREFYESLADAFGVAASTAQRNWYRLVHRIEAEVRDAPDPEQGTISRSCATVPGLGSIRIYPGRRGRRARMRIFPAFQRALGGGPGMAVGDFPGGVAILPHR